MPLQIGARDVAFRERTPQSLVLYCRRAALKVGSSPEDPCTGWFGYAPLTDTLFEVIGIWPHFWIFALQILGVAFVRIFNFITEDQYACLEGPYAPFLLLDDLLSVS